MYHFLRPRFILHFRLLIWLPLCMLLVSLNSAAQVPDHSPGVTLNGSLKNKLTTGIISYQADSSVLSGISGMLRKPFHNSYEQFTQLLYKKPTHFSFWLKFDLTNQTDSSLQLYFYCGSFNYTDIYFVSNDRVVQYAAGGNLRQPETGKLFIGESAPIIPFKLNPKQDGEIYIQLVQKTEEYEFGDVYIYDKPSLYEVMGGDLEDTHYFIVFQLVFQGIMICQLLFALFQWMIIRKREYIYYFLYLLSITLYFLSKYERVFALNLLFSRYPLLAVYLNKTLLILPYFFYFRFVRSFLEMPTQYPVMNKWIVRIEYFLLTYLAFDLSFILITFNVKLQRELYSYILLLVFVVSVCFIFYLFREKKKLIYYILSGSLFVGLGNITALILTYLDDEGILENLPYKLLFSQTGIILEIFCFTAGLSYKSLTAEKDKIRSQEKLIDQLKANDLLQKRMQSIRNQIAQDLHDDIGSTLSSISILSNQALKIQDTGETLSAMEEIKESSVSLMEKMDDIVWSINPRNDSLENLLLRIKRLAIALFEAKDIEYSITIQPKINEAVISMEWRQHLFLIMKEAINNLVKYSDSTIAEIQVKYEHAVLEILIRDMGKGFDTSKPFTGNGLLGMKNRAIAMEATLIIDSAEGKGTTILLALKIK
jgi:signal transduction histidine kinase